MNKPNEILMAFDYRQIHGAWCVVGYDMTDSLRTVARFYGRGARAKASMLADLLANTTELAVLR